MHFTTVPARSECARARATRVRTLFDRSSRQPRLTEAGAELLREGTHLLADIDAIANRVERVATGWEPRFTIAVDSIINSPP